MKRPVVEQPPEQLRYARVLEWASRVGLVVLVASFAAYVSGLMESHVPPEQLPELWVHPVDRFIELTGSPRGWGWVRLIHLGDIAGLLGIAILAGGSVLCLLSIVPLYAARRDRAYVWISVAGAVVVVAAATGWLVGGH
ncbi:MAG TPA: hypothetical protein PKB14_03250 [Rubrivivax sp.]|nr:hypothetical protein [Rubrivivax sp.]